MLDAPYRFLLKDSLLSDKVLLHPGEYDGPENVAYVVVDVDFARCALQNPVEELIAVRQSFVASREDNVAYVPIDVDSDAIFNEILVGFKFGEDSGPNYDSSKSLKRSTSSIGFWVPRRKHDIVLNILGLLKADKLFIGEDGPAMKLSTMLVQQPAFHTFCSWRAELFGALITWV